MNRRRPLAPHGLWLLGLGALAFACGTGADQTGSVSAEADQEADDVASVSHPSPEPVGDEPNVTDEVESTPPSDDTTEPGGLPSPDPVSESMDVSPLPEGPARPSAIRRAWPWIATRRRRSRRAASM